MLTTIIIDINMERDSPSVPPGIAASLLLLLQQGPTFEGHRGRVS